MAKAHLDSAKNSKQDEFYTQWADIEREMNAYLDFNPDVFKGKTILLPCDDPEWSNFTKFFAHHFMDYGIKKLISTSYAPAAIGGKGDYYIPTFFETEHENYKPEKSQKNGRMFSLTADDVNGDGKINFDDITWEYLEGDGDFRSREVTALRDQADMVITNPPFSLFREFVAWLVAGDVLFSVIGNINAITYKEIFPLIKNNQLWKGVTANSTDMVFEVPDGFKIKESDRLKAKKMGYDGNFTRLGNACWFTNIEHGRRHEPMRLMTMSDNLNFNATPTTRDAMYRPYVNADAIEVPTVSSIPSDYEGVMGVPITFLDRYNPEQFEIIKFRKGDDGKDLAYKREDGTVKEPYFRILVRNRNPERQEA